ncbi:MAG: reverse transcriptase domain-containing protein [Verrucomicrobiales bacterium]
MLEPGEEHPKRPDSGTPQGGIISPVLANIYLHYVLDLWIERVISKESRGKVIFMRYADDVIVGFEYKSDADNYLQNLPARLAKFSLSLAEEDSTGKVQSLGTRRQREVHLSGLRLLLGADEEESESQDDQASDEQEEVPSSAYCDEELD